MLNHPQYSIPNNAPINVNIKKYIQKYSSEPSSLIQGVQCQNNSLLTQPTAVTVTFIETSIIAQSFKIQEADRSQVRVQVHDWYRNDTDPGPDSGDW